jgi:hypothetical protein
MKMPMKMSSMSNVKSHPASKAPSNAGGHMRDKPTNPIKVDMGKLGGKKC